MRYPEKQLEKLKKRLEILNEKYSGNEHKFTFYGGQSFGYVQGQIAMLEECLDIISDSSSQEKKNVIKVNCEQANNKGEENSPQKTDYQSPLANALLSKANNISANTAPSDEVAISTQIGKPRFTI